MLPHLSRDFGFVAAAGPARGPSSPYMGVPGAFPRPEGFGGGCPRLFDFMSLLGLLTLFVPLRFGGVRGGQNSSLLDVTVLTDTFWVSVGV